MPDQEVQLARLCGRGDMVAFETLYRRYVQKVWSYARHSTPNREAAADIVQETFLRIARSAGSFRGDSSFSTWLFAIARSAAIDHHRKESRQKGDVLGQAVLKIVPTDEGEPRVVEREVDAKETVRQALGQLAGAQRDTVILCDIMGLKMREAADTLDWSLSRVKVTLFRARAMLRQILTDRPASKKSSGKAGQE